MDTVFIAQAYVEEDMIATGVFLTQSEAETASWAAIRTSGYLLDGPVTVTITPMPIGRMVEVLG